MNKSQQTICLCMIVKNENHVMTRCLDSVRPLIDTWVIVDTGSTDGTQATIREHFRDLPGDLFERPWVDFAHNRTESLELARPRADYLLIIDADEVLELEPGFELGEMDADSYLFPMQSGGLAYYKTQLVRASLGWRFIGVVHEYIYAENATNHKLMVGLHTVRIPDGARSRDPLTFRRDALLLEDALLREPNSSRHMFYLAQSYCDAREPLLALDRYVKRAAMEGWVEETWYSLYRIAMLKRELNATWPEVMSHYLAAFTFYPSRAEPLFHIGYHYQTLKQYPLAHLFFSQAMQIPFPKMDLLYVEQQVYDVLLPLEYSVACYYMGRHQEAVETANQMLAEPGITQELAEKLVLNRSFSLEALYPKRESGAPRSRRVIVCVMLDPAESLSEPCVASLLAQEKEDFQVVVVGNGTSSEARDLPANSAKFLWKQSDERCGWAARLQLAAEETATDDILLILQGTDELIDGSSLDVIASHFQTYDCDLMYGQFTWSDGVRGNAMPLASAEDLEDEAREEGVIAPLALRCSLLSEAPLPDSTKPSDLLRRAGFARIRFNDHPTVTRLSELRG